jgi:hypothetical protein
MTLREFLVKAKVHGYATEGERGEAELENGGKELSYREGSFEYKDRYFGFNPFIGEEVVRENGRIIWAMNYYGAVTDTSIPSIGVYRFLRQAMRHIREDRPFRGPELFSEGGFEYRDESEGDVDCFTGTERILLAGREVYRLDYHGGTVTAE